MTCPRCQSSNVKKNGKRNGYQRYKCKTCKKTWTDSPNNRGGQCIGDRPMTEAEKKRWQRKGEMVANHQSL